MLPPVQCVCVCGSFTEIPLFWCTRAPWQLVSWMISSYIDCKDLYDITYRLKSGHSSSTFPFIIHVPAWLLLLLLHADTRRGNVQTFAHVTETNQTKRKNRNKCIESESCRKETNQNHCSDHQSNMNYDSLRPQRASLTFRLKTKPLPRQQRHSSLADICD